MDALSTLRAERRDAFARNVLPCALEQGIRYGNCPACVLDGFLDSSDCLARCTCGPDSSGEAADVRPDCAPCNQAAAFIGEEPF